MVAVPVQPSGAAPARPENVVLVAVCRRDRSLRIAPTLDAHGTQPLAKGKQ
jgi:hypothetical protein